MQGISPCDHVTERAATGELAFWVVNVGLQNKPRLCLFVMGESGGTCRLMMQGISLCDHVTERECDADVRRYDKTPPSTRLHTYIDTYFYVVVW
jgi:hypothetical protein